MWILVGILGGVVLSVAACGVVVATGAHMLRKAILGDSPVREETVDATVPGESLESRPAPKKRRPFNASAVRPVQPDAELYTFLPHDTTVVEVYRWGAMRGTPVYEEIRAINALKAAAAGQVHLERDQLREQVIVAGEKRSMDLMLVRGDFDERLRADVAKAGSRAVFLRPGLLALGEPDLIERAKLAGNGGPQAALAAEICKDGHYCAISDSAAPIRRTGPRPNEALNPIVGNGEDLKRIATYLNLYRDGKVYFETRMTYWNAKSAESTAASWKTVGFLGTVFGGGASDPFWSGIHLDYADNQLWLTGEWPQEVLLDRIDTIVPMISSRLPNQ